MSTNLKDAMERDRFVNRRKMAWWSFSMFSTLGLFLVFIGLIWPDIVTGIWPQAMFVMGLWGSVVAGYFTITWNTDQTEIKSAATLDQYNAQPAPMMPMVAQGQGQAQVDAHRPLQQASGGF